MSTLRFTAGDGVSFSGACGLLLVWRARKPLPCALMSSATPAPVGHARVIKHHHLGLGLCLGLQRVPPLCLDTPRLWSVRARARVLY